MSLEGEGGKGGEGRGGEGRGGEGRGGEGRGEGEREGGREGERREGREGREGGRGGMTVIHYYRVYDTKQPRLFPTQNKIKLQQQIVPNNWDGWKGDG